MPRRSETRPGSYWAHVTSVRFVVTLVALFGLDAWLETTTIAKRATLGGFDTANAHVAPTPALRTAVIAISPVEVKKYFGGRRPVPPEALDSVVTQLLRLKPTTLVVDVFTDDLTYRRQRFADPGLLAEQGRLVWAQAADTTTGEALPVLGGMPNPPGRSGLAAILADDDRMVRRFRLRYAASGAGDAMQTVASLPMAAVDAFVAESPTPVVRARRAPGDTASIALRTYDRQPPFYLLDDILSSLPALIATPNPDLANRVWILGFIDGSDQVITPSGVRTGSEVVADAVETLLDTRAAIKKLPTWLEWAAKVALALLIGFVYLRFPPRVAAISMIVIVVVVVYLGILVLQHGGYWSNFILIVVGMWIEQLYESGLAQPAGVAHSSRAARTKP